MQQTRDSYTPNTDGSPANHSRHGVNGMPLRTVWLVVLFAVSLVRTLIAQVGASVEHLGASQARVHENWLVYALWESFAGEDLNGDGDTMDEVFHVRDLSTGVSKNLMLAKRPLGSGSCDDGCWMFCSDWLVLKAIEGLHLYRFASGEIRNLGSASYEVRLSEDWLVFAVDGVLHAHKLSTGETRSLRIKPTGFLGVLSGDWLPVGVWEQEVSMDLNGDGDTEDPVLHLLNLATQATTNLKLAGWFGQVFANWVIFEVEEGKQGQDLNGDGDTADQVKHVHDLSTGETTNLGFAGAEAVIGSGDRLAFLVPEQHEDLNGDGDMQDSVLHSYNLVTDQSTNHRLAVSFSERFGDWLALGVREAIQGQDLNGDGDKNDAVGHIHQPSTGQTANLEFAVQENQPFLIAGNLLALWVSEPGQDQDLNEDGDTRDAVVHVRGLTTGRTTNLLLSGDLAAWESEDWLVLNSSTRQNEMAAHDLRTRETTVLTFAGHASKVSGRWLLWSWNNLNFVYDLETEKTTDLGLVGWLRPSQLSFFRDWLVILNSEADAGEDLNGDGDLDDPATFLVDLLAAGQVLRLFHRGDPNSSGATDISDAIATFGFLFLGDPAALSCRESADTNNDGTIDISDGIYLLSWLFTGGPEPVAPGPTTSRCGSDPDPVGSPGDLGCESYSCN